MTILRSRFSSAGNFFSRGETAAREANVCAKAFLLRLLRDPDAFVSREELQRPVRVIAVADSPIPLVVREAGFSVLEVE